MEKIPEIDLYRKALLDYHKPYTGINDNTAYGFCKYFEKVHSISVSEFEDRIPVLKSLFRDGKGNFFATENGGVYTGRIQRIEALNKAIKIIENGKD